jgi:hypothetical protein
MAWCCHCHWIRVIYAVLGGMILWLFKMYPDFGIFNMRWGLFLTCIFFTLFITMKVKKAWATGHICAGSMSWWMTYLFDYWLYISDVSCIVCGPSDGTFLCYLFSSYSWVLYFDTSMVATARGKHTYNKNQAYISISRFQICIHSKKNKKILFC